MRGGDKVKYRVEVTAEQTRLQVASINLEATGTRGQITIEDSLVQLRDVQGETAGGLITTTGDLDFRQPVSRLNFRVDVRHVDLHRLPATWHPARQVAGQLTGQADVHLTVIEGRPHQRQRRRQNRGRPPGWLCRAAAHALDLQAKRIHCRFILSYRRIFPGFQGY